MPKFITVVDNGLTTIVQRWPKWLRPIMQVATFVGLPVVVILVAVAATLLAWQLSQPTIATAVLATLLGMWINSILKHYLHRTRPDTLYVTDMKIRSFSFPSGHAYGTVATYGLFAYLAYQLLPSGLGSSIALVIGALIITVGLSRIYLGAHFPTDVFGGWVLGGITLAVIIAVTGL